MKLQAFTLCLALTCALGSSGCVASTDDLETLSAELGGAGPGDPVPTDPGGGVVRLCEANRVWFDGRCRGVTYFTNHVRDGWTLVDAIGARRTGCETPGCGSSTVTLVESRQGELQATLLTDDRGSTVPPLSVYHASGFRVLSQVRQTYLPTSSEFLLATEYFEPVIDRDGRPLLSQRAWHTTEKTGTYSFEECGTDVMELLSEEGISDQCISTQTIPSGGDAECEHAGNVERERAGTSCVAAAVFGAAAVGFAVFTGGIGAPAAGVVLGIIAASTPLCFQMGAYHADTVETACLLEQEIEPTIGCSTSGPVPGATIVIEFPGDSFIDGEGRQCHQSTKTTYLCAETPSGDCNCDSQVGATQSCIQCDGEDEVCTAV